jgi:hypothetical protein
VVLVFDVEASILNVTDGLCELLVTGSKEYAIFNIHHKNDFALVEDTIIDQ